MDSITIKSLTLKPSQSSTINSEQSKRFIVPMDDSGKLVYSDSTDFFKLNDLSDVETQGFPEGGEAAPNLVGGSTLVYDSTLEKWTNKRIFKEIPIRKTFRNVNVHKVQINKALGHYMTPKIRVKTTCTFTIQNDCVCPNSLIFTGVHCGSGSYGADVHCVVQSISDKQFEVILVNYKPEQKVKKDAYKIDYLVINQ